MSPGLNGTSENIPAVRHSHSSSLWGNCSARYGGHLWEVTSSPTCRRTSPPHIDTSIAQLGRSPRTDGLIKPPSSILQAIPSADKQNCRHRYESEVFWLRKHVWLGGGGARTHEAEAGSLSLRPAWRCRWMRMSPCSSSPRPPASLSL